jgi:Ca2+-binding RTX toxin-like protein
LSGTVTVADAPLTATAANIIATEGTSTGQVTVATFTDANPDATAADFTATISWGDGTTSAGTVAAASGGGFSVDGAHSYAEEGQYTVGVSIDDQGGSTADTSGTATVANASLTPTLSGTLANIGVVNETPATPLSGLTVIDPGVGDTDTVTITLANPAFGVLSNLSGGSYDSTTGVYIVTGSPSAVTTAIDALQLTPATPASNVFVASTAFTVSVVGPDGGPAAQNAVVASVQQVLGLASVPVGNIAISVSADGTSFAAPINGHTNEAVMTSPTTGDTYTLPAGYQAEYLGGSANVTLQDTGVGDVVLVGNTGNDVLIAAVANDSIVAGNGNNTLEGGSGTVALDAGNGDDLVTTSADSTYTVTLGGGNDTVYAGGSGTVTGGSNIAVFGGIGSLNVNAAGGMGALVAFGQGGGTFASSSASSGALMFGGAGVVSVDGSNTSNDTVVGGSAALTVNAGSGINLLVFGPVSGPGMDFIDGSSSPTVVGQAGSDTITGSGGPLEIIAGDNEALSVSGGSGGATVFGAPNADIGDSASAGTLLLVAGAGNETLNASGSSSDNAFWGGRDSTAGNLLVGGAGDDVMVAGLGADTFSGGGGNNDFLFLNQIMSVLGSNGPHDVITDFAAGSDVVGLFGGLSVTGSASASGNTTVTLSDNTTIEFVGVGSYSEISSRIFTG